MFFSLTLRVASTVVAFVYPGYASYKALSQRPASEDELEKWLMYWSVLGCIVGLEYTAEWLISWLPFYSSLKTLLLLYLALPHTSGSNYIYRSHMQPQFNAHEAEVDQLLASLKSRAYVLLQTQARRAWTHVVSSAAAPRPADLMSEDPVAQDAAAGTGAPPTIADPLSGPAQLFSSLWGSYGPGLLISGAALLQQSSAPGAPLGMNATARASSTASEPAAARPRMQHAGSSEQSASERRRQLEAELAALDAGGEAAGQTPTPAPSGFRQRARPASALEEAEVPSDIE